MENPFSKVMSERSDEALIKIITDPVEDYQPEALEAAKAEFSRRNLSEDIINKAVANVEEDKSGNEQIANAPLQDGWKIIAFLVPGMVPLLISGLLKAEGYERRASEASTWTLYGIVFYLILIFLLTTFF